MSIEVKKSSEYATLNIPVKLDEIETSIANIKEHLKRFIEEASEKFNIPLEEALKCIPDNIELPPIAIQPPKKEVKNKTTKSSTIKSPKKPAQVSSNKLTIDNWDSAVDKVALKSLKIESLKNILSIKGLSITGTKTVLIDRVWNLLDKDSNEISSTKEPKKKGRKPKSKTKKSVKNDTSIVEDSDNEQETIVNINCKNKDNVEYLVENSSEILYINKDTMSAYSKPNGNDNEVECLLIPSKHWVFKNNEDTLEYLGILCNNKVIEGNPPQDLLDASA